MQGYIIAVVTVFTTDMQYQNNNKAENAQKPHKAKWNFHVQWMLLHLSKRCRNSRLRVEVKPRSIPWQKREGKGHRAAQEQSGLCSALGKVLFDTSFANPQILSVARPAGGLFMNFCRTNFYLNLMCDPCVFVDPVLQIQASCWIGKQRTKTKIWIP